MNTRTGKIAQLPKSIRHQLNHRLQNGAQSPDLLNWLNDLPETKDLLTAKFDHQPITKSNLSHWRHGGFLDWLRDQERDQRIQRVTESSLDPAHTQEPTHLFANIVRFTLAELITDLDSLPKLRGQKRSQQLHHLIRDLSRLQNSYNRTRSADLAWTKYNDNRQANELETTNSKLATSSAPTTVAPDDTSSREASQHESSRPRDKQPETLITLVQHTKCYEGCICSKCHAPDSEYPLDEVLRDQKFREEHHHLPRDRHGNFKYLTNCSCDCFCDYCAKKHPNNQPFATNEIPSGTPLSEPARSSEASVAAPQACAAPSIDTNENIAPSNAATKENTTPPPSPSSPLTPLEKLQHQRELAHAAALAHFLQKFGPRASAP